MVLIQCLEGRRIIKTSFSDDISPSSSTFFFRLLRNDWINSATLLLSIAFCTSYDDMVLCRRFWATATWFLPFNLKAIYCSSWVSHDLLLAIMWYLVIIVKSHDGAAVDTVFHDFRNN